VARGGLGRFVRRLRAWRRYARAAQHFSLLKNSITLTSVPGSKTEHAVFVVFWPCFRALLDHRPGRQLLFQQADSFYEVRCMSLVSASKEPMDKESALFILHV
jgi:hypothetical protein